MIQICPPCNGTWGLASVHTIPPLDSNLWKLLQIPILKPRFLMCFCNRSINLHTQSSLFLSWRHTFGQDSYTGCPRRNVPNFGRVFLMLKYTDITQNTYIKSWTVTEIMVYFTFKTSSRHYVIYFNHMVLKVNHVVQGQSPDSRSTTGSNSRKPTLYSHFFMTSTLRLATILDGPKTTPSTVAVLLRIHTVVVNYWICLFVCFIVSD
jgi:hypothetical protein